VLIHPSLWDARIWDDQFDRFSSHHDVIRYDLRGSGRSDPPTRPYSELRDLLTLLEELDIGRCALVGCGSGARLAVDVALASPGVADALVLASPGLSGYVWSDPGLPVLEAEVERAVRAGDLEGAMEMQLAVWAPLGSHPTSDERVRAIARDNLRVSGRDGASIAAPPSAAERLEEIAAATLVIVGDRDLAETHAIADLLASRIPGASKRVVADADLLVNLRKPEKFNRLVLDFLSFRM
jgi:pimeloyl-ACP methyl ester carboxylesterase